jgi:DNA-directed RNA polymerase III subunit RPC6
LQKSTDGATQQTLIDNIPGLTSEELATSINFLISKNKVQLFTNQSGTTVFKAVKQSELISEKTEGLTFEQKLLYHIIQASDRDGIPLKILISKSNLNKAQVPKIIKALEQKSLIKSFRSIANKSTVHYILSHLQPAERHIGGIWYTPEGEFDRPFVDVLTKQCSLFIKEKGYATIPEIHCQISKSGLSKVEVREEDIKKLVNSLIYDGKIESFEISREEIGYKRTKFKQIIPDNFYSMMPCGICPVFNLCGSNTDITPEKCVHMTRWIEEW